MTADMMHLQTLVVKTSDADMLPTMIGYAAERPIDMEMSARTGAAPRRGLGGRNRFATAILPEFSIKTPISKRTRRCKNLDFCAPRLGRLLTIDLFQGAIREACPLRELWGCAIWLLQFLVGGDERQAHSGTASLYW
jgi:hypothetical protein